MRIRKTHVLFITVFLPFLLFGEGEKTRLIIVDFKAPFALQQKSDSVVSILTKVLSESGSFTILGPDEIDLATHNNQKLRSCGNDIPCIVQLGRQVGADGVIIGSVRGTNDSFIISIQVVGVFQGGIVVNDETVFTNGKILSDHFRQVAGKIALQKFVKTESDVMQSDAGAENTSGNVTTGTNQVQWKKIAIAVIKFLAPQSLQDTANSATLIFRKALTKSNLFNVIKPSDIDRATFDNPDMQSCDNNVPCLVHLGKLINADKVVMGSVRMTNDSIIILSQIIDISSGEIDLVEETAFKDDAQLDGTYKALVEKIALKKPIKRKPDMVQNKGEGKGTNAENSILTNSGQVRSVSNAGQGQNQPKNAENKAPVLKIQPLKKPEKDSPPFMTDLLFSIVPSNFGILESDYSWKNTSYMGYDNEFSRNIWDFSVSGTIFFKPVIVPAYAPYFYYDYFTRAPRLFFSVDADSTVEKNALSYGAPAWAMNPATSVEDSTKTGLSGVLGGEIFPFHGFRNLGFNAYVDYFRNSSVLSGNNTSWDPRKYDGTTVRDGLGGTLGSILYLDPAMEFDLSWNFGANNSSVTENDTLAAGTDIYKSALNESFNSGTVSFSILDKWKTGFSCFISVTKFTGVEDMLWNYSLLPAVNTNSSYQETDWNVGGSFSYSFSRAGTAGIGFTYLTYTYVKPNSNYTYTENSDQEKIHIFIDYFINPMFSIDFGATLVMGSIKGTYVFESGDEEIHSGDINGWDLSANMNFRF